MVVKTRRRRRLTCSGDTKSVSDRIDTRESGSSVGGNTKSVSDSVDTREPRSDDDLDIDSVEQVDEDRDMDAMVGQVESYLQEDNPVSKEFRLSDFNFRRLAKKRPDLARQLYKTSPSQTASVLVIADDDLLKDNDGIGIVVVDQEDMYMREIEKELTTGKNGLPLLRLSVASYEYGQRDIVYDFEFIVKQSTIPGSGNGVFRKFVGARKVINRKVKKNGVPKKDDDYEHLPKKTFCTMNDRYCVVNIGEYGNKTIDKNQAKLKSFILSQKPSEYFMDRYDDGTGKTHTLDIIDDITGLPCDKAILKSIPMHMNEVGHDPVVHLHTVHAVKGKGKNAVDYAWKNHKELYPGDEEELFADYTLEYEEIRCRHGYGREKELGDDHIPSRLRRNFELRASMEGSYSEDLVTALAPACQTRRKNILSFVKECFLSDALPELRPSWVEVVALCRWEWLSRNGFLGLSSDSSESFPFLVLYRALSMYAKGDDILKRFEQELVEEMHYGYDDLTDQMGCGRQKNHAVDWCDAVADWYYDRASNGNLTDELARYLRHRSTAVLSQNEEAARIIQKRWGLHRTRKLKFLELAPGSTGESCRREVPKKEYSKSQLNEGIGRPLFRTYANPSVSEFSPVAGISAETNEAALLPKSNPEQELHLESAAPKLAAEPTPGSVAPKRTPQPTPGPTVGFEDEGAAQKPNRQQEAKIVLLEKAIEELESNNEQLQKHSKELEKKDQHINELEKQLEDLQTEIATLRERLGQQDRENAHLRARETIVRPKPKIESLTECRIIRSSKQKQE